jgi:hypothetical protein
MDAYTILITLGCVVSGITWLISFIFAKRKWQARRQLVEKLTHDPYFRRLVDIYLATVKENKKATDEELNAIRKRIEEELGRLDIRDRVRVQSGLFQPSSVGRRRFVEKIARDVEERRTESADHSSHHSPVGC